MGFRKIEEFRKTGRSDMAESDEDILAEVGSSWAAWHIATLAAVIAVILLSVASLVRMG
jgi:hypothetical protein